MSQKENDDYHYNYIYEMVKYQDEHNLSCCEMADLLNISTSTYKNIIYGKTSSIELSLIMSMYALNKMPMYKMTGVEPPNEFVSTLNYRRLTCQSQRLVDDFIEMLLRREGKEP